MLLSEFKEAIKKQDKVEFQMKDGSMVPSHYHITEVGLIDKHFIDCGGKVRSEQKIGFQLFTAEDFDHRLKAQKLLSIIELSEKALNLTDREIEVEYQGKTIGKYGLQLEGDNFILTTTQTDCLAKDKCGIPETKAKVQMQSLGKKEEKCDPAAGCC